MSRTFTTHVEDTVDGLSLFLYSEFLRKVYGSRCLAHIAEIFAILISERTYPKDFSLFFKFLDDQTSL